MSELVEARWSRFGHDRVYLRTPDGVNVGYVDLRTGTTADVQPGFESAVEECRGRWAGDAAPTVSTPAIPPPVAEADRTPNASTRDLAGNVASAQVHAKRDEANAQAPIRNLVARVLGVKTEERAWRVGANGEEKVADQLAKLGSEWHVLHSVPVGDRGSDIDHVVIGPPGVFTLNTKRHPGGRATVGARRIWVNGQSTDYLRNSRFEADRAQKLLTKACGFSVAVQPVVVFVNLADFKVKQAPEQGVAVTERRALVGWLRSCPLKLLPHDVGAIFSVARSSTTWQPATA